jgi:hypothetical protein
MTGAPIDPAPGYVVDIEKILRASGNSADNEYLTTKVADSGCTARIHQRGNRMARLFPALTATGSGSAKPSEAYSPKVRRDVELQMERASAETEATSERAERFS